MKTTKPLKIMRKHKYLAIVISIVVGTIWLSLVMYTISIGRNTAKVISPTIVATSSVHQTSTGVSAVTPFKATSSSFIQHVTPAATSTPAPQATMGSTSMRLHETSGATAHNVGSGLGAGQGVMVTTSGSQRGIAYAGLGFGGNMLALSSALPITKPGAGRANEIASTTLSEERNATPGVHRTPVNPWDPFLTPLGDVAWILIAILALAYAYIIYRKRARA